MQINLNVKFKKVVIPCHKISKSQYASFKHSNIIFYQHLKGPRISNKAHANTSLLYPLKDFVIITISREKLSAEFTFDFFAEMLMN